MSAGSADTNYLRAGRGEPPVVLLAAPAVAGGEPALLAPLAERFRVIAPCATASRSAASDGRFTGWLRDFLDGLGLGAVAVVAEPALADAALRFARAEPSRVACVVLVASATTERADIHLLVHGGDVSPPIVAAEIAPFIAAHS